MGVYDSWNFDGLKFFSQIKERPDRYISEPCGEFINVVKYFKMPPETLRSLKSV